MPRGVWRVMVVWNDATADLLFTDRLRPTYLKRHLLSGLVHVRERTRVLRVGSVAGTINRWGEPFEGPSHQKIYRPGLGRVTVFTPKELWRLQGAEDREVDRYARLHPQASYEDFAEAAGDAMAKVYTMAVASRTTTRLAFVEQALRPGSRQSLAARRVQRWWRRSRQAGRTPSVAPSTAPARTEPAEVADAVEGAAATGNERVARALRRRRGPTAQLITLVLLHLSGGAVGEMIDRDVRERMGLEASVWDTVGCDSGEGSDTCAGGPEERQHGEIGGTSANAARAALLYNSVTTGTKNTYSSAFGHWIVWRRARGDPLLLNPSEQEKWEDELVDFYCHGAHTCGYAPKTMHLRLHAVRRFHRLRRINLDIRDEAMPFLSSCKRGHKAQYGAPRRKVAVSMRLLRDVSKRGGLNLKRWDGLLVWVAILMGFFFLLRCSEYLRKGAKPDAQKCFRVRNIFFAAEGEVLDVESTEPCDEVGVHHDFSKSDWMGQGSDSNIKAARERAFSLPHLWNQLRQMQPEHFVNEEKYLFTREDGSVLSKADIEKPLKEASVRAGIDPSSFTPHSLRSGGCTAMLGAGVPEWRIQARGRWKSNCWKDCNWPTRDRDNGLADMMIDTAGNLFAYD